MRTGQDPGLAPTGGQGWEHELYAKRARLDHRPKVEPAGDAKAGEPTSTNADYGFQTSLREPDQYRKGAAAGPAARRRPRAGARDVAVARVPPRQPQGRRDRAGDLPGALARPRAAPHCAGAAGLQGVAADAGIRPWAGETTTAALPT